MSLLLARGARAAGLGIPDLTAGGLAQGGATIARPTDLSALYYNPGALGFLEGWQFYLDVRAINHQVGFQRLQSDGTNPSGWLPIENAGGISLAPVFGVSWHHDIFTLSIGGHPATGASGYEYPDPSEVTGSVTRYAPQRYLSIESHSKIYVPMIAAAVQLAPWISLGAGLQLPVAYFSSRQIVYAGPFSGELPDFDADVDLSANQWFARSGIFGVSMRPIEWLDIGASVQLETHFHTSGKIAAKLPPTATNIGLTVSGDQIKVDIMFPWIARLGVRGHFGALSVELAGTFEKWSRLKEIRIIPVDVVVNLGNDVIPLPNLVLEKQLQDSGSVRLGGEYVLNSWLTLRAGALYETSAIPENRQALDWVHWDRFSLNAGAKFTWGKTDFSVALGHFFQADRQVRDSVLHQLTAFPEVTPTIIGNGNFSSTINQAAFAVSTRL